jgi:MFS family permease
MAGLTTGNRKWWILTTMTAALSMVLIDETVVSVALPAIQQHLHMSPSGRQWPVNAYLLALAACVTAEGRLGELAGQARMFRPSAVVFVAASAGCGLAPARGVDHRSAGRAEAGRGRDDAGLRGDVITAFSGASGAAPWAATRGARRPRWPSAHLPTGCSPRRSAGAPCSG